MPEPVRVAAVGLGWVALHRHLPVMDRSGRYEVVGVIDRTPGRAGSVAAARGYRRHAQADELAAVPWIDEVEAITIATAPMSHHDLIGQALALGKHVISEKPFTMQVNEARSLAALAARSDLRLAVVHNFQFARSALKLAADLEADALGEIVSFAAVQLGNPRRRLPAWYEDLPLGLFYDESPHLLYLLRRFCGRLRLNSAVVMDSLRGCRTPARVDAYFDGDRYGLPITLHCNFESPVSEWYLLAFGEKKLAIVDIFRDLYLRLDNDGPHDTRRVLRTSLTATVQHWLQHGVSGAPHLMGRLFYGNEVVFDRFARAVEGDEQALEPISAHRALEVVELQHAIINQPRYAPSAP